LRPGLREARFKDRGKLLQQPPVVAAVMGKMERGGKAVGGKLAPIDLDRATQPSIERRFQAATIPVQLAHVLKDHRAKARRP